jgi:hypothetical protein
MWYSDKCPRGDEFCKILVFAAVTVFNVERDKKMRRNRYIWFAHFTVGTYEYT